MSEEKGKIKDDNTDDPIVPKGEEGGETVELPKEEYNVLLTEKEKLASYEEKISSYESGSKAANEAMEKLTAEKVQVETQYLNLAKDNPEYLKVNELLPKIDYKNTIICKPNDWKEKNAPCDAFC